LKSDVSKLNPNVIKSVRNLLETYEETKPGSQERRQTNEFIKSYYLDNYKVIKI
jgi:hypothetical protein